METENVFIPDGPYQFKSGRHQGEYVESFIFKNSAYLFRVKNRDHYASDKLDIHLRFIFNAGQKLETKILCPFCRTNKVKCFIILNSVKLLPGLTCCENSECKNKLKFLHPNHELVRFNFQALEIFQKINLRGQAERFFKKVYGLPGKLTPDFIFKTLKNALRPNIVNPKPINNKESLEPVMFYKSRFRVKPNATQLNLIF